MGHEFVEMKNTGAAIEHYRLVVCLTSEKHSKESFCNFFEVVWLVPYSSCH